MADLVVGLAKSVVEGALTKAQAAIEEEARLRQSAQRNLVFITGEFEMMHSFLKVADEERLKNKVVMTWVRQIRELAYDVEDCIELVVHLDMKNRWWLRIIPSWCMAQVLPLDEAVGEIEQLKARVEDVSTRNARYSLIGDTGSKPVVVQQELPAPDAAVAAATSDMLAEARGATKRQQGFSDLARLVTQTDVISVWGAAGDHGTTAIIRKTYNHPGICQDFATRSWVKITHPFSPHQFMRNMMAQFYATSCNQQRAAIGRHVLTKMEATHEDLFGDFQELFTDKRCLIVLEGLSHMVDWDAIRAFLPELKNGSCIIVSTKQPEIATMCIGPSYQILELKKYSAQHSVCALFKVNLSSNTQASQADVNRDQKTMGSQNDEDKGKKKMAYEVTQIISFNRKTMSPKKEEADEWMKNHPLIGRQQQLTELGNFLAEARVNSPAVMSVWGIAEVGKSTLVKYLFYDIILNSAEKYDKYFWVDISHPFNIRDLYLSILSDIHSEKDPTEECQELLKKHRCLIVIDGIRSTKDWDMMQDALVSKYSRSVIIVITTQTSIATYCTIKEDLVFNVKALETADAFELFKTLVIKQKSAYPLKDQDAEVKYLVSKCGGLPKVISSIAGLLAKKTEKRMGIVRSLNERFMHHLETDPEYDNLQDLFGWMHLYFRTCPDELKPCIFYLSIFPQDQIIRRRRLVRRWIAEGYSRDSHNESAEENGEKHFSDLLELSIIQQLSSQSSSSSSVNSSSFSVDVVMMVMCQVNGFIREYVVSRRMEENLVFELGDKCALTTQRTGRHLVILDKWKRDRIVYENMDFSRLRSLTVFGGWESFFISKGMKMLRVLDLENASALNEDDLYKMVKRLRRLKFISLRGHPEINHLPGSLHRLRQLQTLDVRGTSITTLPKKIAKLEKLQYIRAGTKDFQRPVSSSNGLVDDVTAPVSPSNSVVDAMTPVSPSNSSWFPGFCRNHHPTVGVEVQTGIGKLTALHTLGVVNITASGAKCAVKELQQLTQLRKLGVTGINRKNNGSFFNAIKDHVYLESLSIWLDKGNKQGCCFRKDNDIQGFLDNMISLPCMNLRSLKLYGLENRLPNWGDDQLRKLAKLELEMPTLLEEDIKFLGRLPQLCILRLKQLRDCELHFCVFMNGFEDDSYKKIKILEIACGSSTRSLHVTFGSWTMRQLELLKVDCCGMSPPYPQFSGLKNLVELKEILLVNGSNASALKQALDLQLDEHPNKNKKPVVKVEETPLSS